MIVIAVVRDCYRVVGVVHCPIRGAPDRQTWRVAYRTAPWFHGHPLAGCAAMTPATWLSRVLATL
jgi:hypothetical protein